MTSQNIKDTSQAPSASEVEEMAKYDIIRVPVDYFHYRQFRYTNLEDALAQAKCDLQRTD